MKLGAGADLRRDERNWEMYRMKRLALPRQIMMYLMRKEIKSSFPTIGQEVGGRDHTTAIHAFEKISREVQDNEKIRTDVELIKQRLYSMAPAI